MAIGHAASAPAHAWADDDDPMVYGERPLFRDGTRTADAQQMPSAPSSSNALTYSSNAVRAAAQVGHHHQVTQPVSSRLELNAGQAGTTSRTIRTAWTATPAPSRSDGKLSGQHERAAAFSPTAGCRSDATARVSADGAAHFCASTGAHVPMHGAPTQQHYGGRIRIRIRRLPPLRGP
jgi:hypothetical protein